MSTPIRIILAQQNFLVGDIEGNAEKIMHCITTARNIHHADLIVFPELALSGYPPEDLLFRADFYARIETALSRICAHTTGIAAIIGYPTRDEELNCYNSAVCIQQQHISHYYAKQKLPNYQVFDEVRYFKPGPSQACIIEVRGIKIAITICEDIWFPEPIAQAKTAGAELILSLNASPFAQHKVQLRRQVLQQRTHEAHLPILYVNCVGGQDELVFDGGSMAITAQGQLAQQANFFQEQLCLIELHKNSTHIEITAAPLPAEMQTEAAIYQALVLGLRDYIEKNHFPSAILGLSGGIDSALTLAIAVDAIGKERVQAVMMPSRYNAAMSLEDAQLQADIMGVVSQVLPIEPIFQAFLNTLQPEFQGLPADTTEENLQARCRGTLLMAISNKKHAIVLATGNKSELAVGYSTLYGDMVGGFCVLKDVFKTMVYRLAHYRNSLSPVIPERVLTRAPSAELAPDQTDQDTLPPYPVLDEILQRYIERDESISSIITAGFDETTVRRVVQMVDRNEYKRRQAAPGIRITEHAFGKDRRYPITSGFKAFLV